MSMSEKIKNNSVKTVTVDKIEIGGDKALPFLSENNNNSKPLFALEIPYILENFPQDILKNHWGETKDFKELFQKAQNTDCDIICIHLNIDEKEIDSLLEKLLKDVSEAVNSSVKPVILKGNNNKNIDSIILPLVAKSLNKRCIIAYADEKTYETILPSVIENNHVLVLRSPIDINLAKELNILSMDAGLDAQNILIDPDMGALGYGLDYGYSIIERIRQAAFDGDKMLQMPIITFIGEETFKVKEAKSDKFSKSWGNYEERAQLWEITTASAIISAGANVVVLFNPESIKILKETLWN